MNQASNKVYNLAERTTVFAAAVLEFSKSLKLDKISEVLIVQLVRCVTSIGANYMEARNGSSKKDFINKIYICKKEAQEAEYWLKLSEGLFPMRREEIAEFSNESHELLLIFQKIISSSKIKQLQLKS